MKLSRREFAALLAAIPATAFLPKFDASIRRMVWATTDGPHIETIPGGFRVNWGTFIAGLKDPNGNPFRVSFVDASGNTHTWVDGKWSDGTPEIMFEYTA